MPCTKDIKVDTAHPVLVTGGTGYVAGVLIQKLLEAGAKVHTTVRDPSNKERLAPLLAIEAKTPGTLIFFKADLLDENSFDKAMEGCTTVFHTASPFFTGEIKDPMNTFIKPAVQGTTNVLQAVNRTQTVRRVVLTSSTMSMATDAADHKKLPGGMLTEESWNRTASLSHVPYALSKAMAEQKAWVIAGSQTRWSLVTISPPLILGPGIKFSPSSESYDMVLKFGTNDFTMIGGAPRVAMGAVDVRDVADAHIAAAFLPKAKGRYIVSAKNSSVAEFALTLKKIFPEYPFPSLEAPVPKILVWLLAPYSGLGLSRRFVTGNLYEEYRLDTSKSRSDLGIEYLSLEQTLKDMGEQMIAAGAFKKGKHWTNYLF